MDIMEVIKKKFNSQTARTNKFVKCPHCGKKLDFQFEHTQNTTVETKLVDLKKGE